MKTEPECLLTTYGVIEVRARRVSGSNVWVLLERHVVPAGATTRMGTILKKDKSIPAGTVLVPHWDDYDAPGAEKFFHLFPGGIFDALRSLMHALFGYGVRNKPGELQQITGFMRRIDDVVCVLLQRHTIASARVEEAQRDVASIAYDLRNALHKKKVEARSTLAKAATLEVPYRGKPRRNVPANIRRIDAAKSRLNRRSLQIDRIVPRVAFFEQALASEIGRILRGLEEVIGTLAMEASRLERRKKPYSEAERKVFFRRYHNVRAVLNEIHCAPFVHAVQLARADIGEAANFLDRGKLDKTASSLHLAVRGLKCKLAQVYFERTVVFPMSLRMGLGAFSPADAERFAKKLKKIRISTSAHFDDTGFRTPVKKRFLFSIDEAITFLEAGKYHAAKDSIKRASRTL